MELNFIRSQQVKTNVVVEINYPDCTNYEGNKIIVFRNVSIQEIDSIKSIDTHFCEDRLSPFAIFKATEFGWNAAIHLAKWI